MIGRVERPSPVAGLGDHEGRILNLERRPPPEPIGAYSPIQIMPLVCGGFGPTDPDNTGGSYAPTIDNEQFYNLGFGGSTLGIGYSWPVVLGPKDSAWSIVVVLEQGPSFGQITFSLAGPYDFYDTIGLSSTFGGDYIDFLTYEAYSNAESSNTGKNKCADFVNEGKEPHVGGSAGAGIYGGAAIYRVGGDPGIPLTDISFCNPSATLPGINAGVSGLAYGNGGSGYYVLSVRTTGKNAESSGYDVNICHLSLERQPEYSHFFQGGQPDVPTDCS